MGFLTNRIKEKAGQAGQPSLLCESSTVLFTAVSWICLRSTADGVIWKNDGQKRKMTSRNCNSRFSGLYNVII